MNNGVLNNFRTASVSSDVHQARLDALQEDFTRLLDEGGVSAIAARPAWQMRAAQLIRETVIDEFSMTDPTPMLVERRDARLGDKIEFERLVNTLRVVRYAPMSHPQVFTPRKGKYTITTAMYELAFGLPLQKILTRQHTVGEYVSMAAEAVSRHYIELVLSAIDTACSGSQNDPKGNPTRTTASGADVTQNELDAALRGFVAVNSGATIMGSRYALEPIMGFAATDGGDVYKEELMRRGVVGTYKGATLVAFDDDYNEYYNSWTSVNGVDIEKRIFIIGGQPGATLLERDISALNWEELDVKKAQFGTGVRWDHGVFVHTPWRYHVIALV